MRTSFAMSGLLARDVVELVADAARLVVGAPDREAVGRLRGRELLDRLPALHAGQLRRDAVGGELRTLLVGQDQLDRHAVPPLAP